MDSNYSQESTLRQILSGILGTIPYGIVCIADNGSIEAINQKSCDILGLPDKQAKDFLDIDFGVLFENLKTIRNGINENMFHSSKNMLDLPEVPISGKSVDIKCRRMLRGVLIVIRDITQESLLIHRATHDSLTQIYNRQHFEELLSERIKSHELDHRDSIFAFLDVDNFKSINDKYGHSCGDDLLKEIASIVKSRIRTNDLFARIGGDEFALFFENCSLTRAEEIIQGIIRKIEGIELYSKDKVIRTTVSVGVTSFKLCETDTFSSMMSVADTACQIAKNEGRNTLHTIDGNSCEFKEHLENVQWIDEIEYALKQRSMILYGQLIQHTEYADASYIEVLVRLERANGEVISPAAFIPQAERYHIMPLIDYYVIEEVVKQMQNDIVYSVNLSGQTISNTSFVDFITKLQETYVFSPSQITFEITETTAMMSIDSTLQNIVALKKLGFSFSLDDFGTGLASFNYLKTLPVDTVKIDGLFVRDITSNQVSLQIVKSICDVARSMGLKTVAEFVTDKATFESVKAIKVDYAQGFYLHKPEQLSLIGKKPGIVKATA